MRMSEIAWDFIAESNPDNKPIVVMVVFSNEITIPEKVWATH